MKTGLVLEGGAFRTIFSSGVCDAFLDLGLPMPDCTIGCFRRHCHTASAISPDRVGGICSC